MSLLSQFATAIGTALSSLVHSFTSFQHLSGTQDDEPLPEADREERDLRILMNHWF